MGPVERGVPSVDFLFLGDLTYPCVDSCHLLLVLVAILNRDLSEDLAPAIPSSSSHKMNQMVAHETQDLY